MNSVELRHFGRGLGGFPQAPPAAICASPIDELPSRASGGCSEEDCAGICASHIDAPKPRFERVPREGQRVQTRGLHGAGSRAAIDGGRPRRGVGRLDGLLATPCWRICSIFGSAGHVMSADPLAAYAAARHASLFETTLTLLERGKAEDDADRSGAAVLLYAEAVGGLEALLELEPEGRRRALLLARLAEYGERLTEMQAVLLRQAAARATARPTCQPSGAPGSGVQPGDAQQSSAVATSGAEGWDDSGQALHIASSSAARPPSAHLASARLETEMAVQADEAGDTPEALQLYTSAAEHLFAALRLEDDAEDGAAIRQRLAAVMDRAEQLKATRMAAGGGQGGPGLGPEKASQGAPGGAAAAARAGPCRTESIASDAVGAFAAVAAGVLAVPGGGALAACGGVSGGVGGGAGGGGGGGAGGGGANRAGGLRLTEAEKRVLARSSRIGRLVHYPWIGGEHSHERFGFPVPWEDPDGLLPLNREQKANFGGWARPASFMRGEPTMIFLVSPLTITQTIITDCSFVSSLVIAAAYERKFRRKLITAILHPQVRSASTSGVLQGLCIHPCPFRLIPRTPPSPPAWVCPPSYTLPTPIRPASSPAHDRPGRPAPPSYNPSRNHPRPHRLFLTGAAHPPFPPRTARARLFITRAASTWCVSSSTASTGASSSTTSCRWTGAAGPCARIRPTLRSCGCRS